MRVCGAIGSCYTHATGATHGSQRVSATQLLHLRKSSPLVLGASGWFCLRSLPCKPPDRSPAPGRTIAELGWCLTVVWHVVMKKTWAATVVAGIEPASMCSACQAGAPNRNRTGIRRRGDGIPREPSLRCSARCPQFEDSLPLRRGLPRFRGASDTDAQDLRPHSRPFDVPCKGLGFDFR